VARDNAEESVPTLSFRWETDANTSEDRGSISDQRGYLRRWQQRWFDEKIQAEINHLHNRSRSMTVRVSAAPQEEEVPE
jgi:hypothetical protein